MLLDPRLSVVERRLRSVGRIIAVASSKGGVGKTVIASCLSLALSGMGRRVGLLDLDFTNTSCHIVLGVDVGEVTPVEEKGVVPPVVHGVKFMTIAFYTGDHPLPLRGGAAENAVRELLAVTIWGPLDYLVVDLPPGIGDQLLSLLTYMRGSELLVVTTPSPLSVRSVERLIKLLRAGGHKVLGLVENMASRPSPRVMRLVEEYELRHLASIPYVEGLDEMVGDVDKLMSSEFGAHVKALAKLVDGITG